MGKIVTDLYRYSVEFHEISNKIMVENKSIIKAIMNKSRIIVIIIVIIVIFINVPCDQINKHTRRIRQQ